MFSGKLTRSIVLGAAAVAVAGGSYGVISATSSSGSTAAGSAFAGGPKSGGDGGSNARSGPATGGATGKIGNLSASGFTMTTSAGQEVTVDETATTAYKKGTTAISASVITTGEPVLVLGLTSGTTITATQVIGQPAGSGGSGTSSATKVTTFQRDAPTTSKKVGKIPASYSEGSGTIISGTAANKATEAALATYPGGIVDRVVKLTNGEYEVHNIGVNWPHHVFVDQNVKVVGAE